MDFDEYQHKAYSTAIYKEKLLYPVLGLIDEIGEFLEKAYNYTTDKKEIDGERGDVMWYIAAICSDLNISLNDVYNMDKPNIESASNLEIMMAAAAICGKTKKLLRDKDGIVNEVYISFVSKKLNFILHVFDDKFSDLPVIMEDNIKKLFSRKERGVLKGDGDNR